MTQGKLGGDGVFYATEVLAKHDENYMPPPAADAIKQAQSINEKATHTLVESAQMIPELGQLALALALCLALAQCLLGLVGAARGESVWMAATRPVARGQFAFVAIAFACLTASFVSNDFTVAYVASNSNSALPLHYRIAGVWGGHEGSMLLWILMLSVWTFGVTLFSRHLPLEMVARVLGVMGGVSVGFILFILFTSNPFLRLFPAPPDGRDLNPLLQDPGMVAHPPMLYMGYVGFSIAFSFAVAALLSGRLDAAWARWSRPWTTAAWCFLTVGIALGSGWAYYELGWGGWWFWDPVENASFMPWLTGTALIHSLAVTEKRGAFRSWTVLLAILAFALSLLGTFLVRSGVLTSVHAFATDPTRGIFILALLAIVIGGSLLLYVWRAPKIGLGGGFEIALARVDAADEQRDLRRGRGLGAARHALPARARRLGPGQDLGRAAVLRDGVRAADGAGALPHGRGAARALEEGESPRPRLAPALGARGQRARRACAAVRHGPLGSDGRARAAARGVGRCERLRAAVREGAQCCRRRERLDAAAERPARDVRHAARSLRRRGVRRRRDPGERLRIREGRAHGAG